MKPVLVGLSLFALVSCQSGLGPAADISGTWFGSGLEHSLTLNLVQQGTTVQGTGNSWGFISPPTHQYSITGSYALPTVTLTLTREDTTVSQLTGTVVDSRHMISVQRIGAFSDTLRLTRQ